MRILAAADMEDNSLEAHLAREGRGAYDAVVSCGDLSMGYLDYVATLADAPLLYVRGNHDIEYENDPHLCGTNLDGRIDEVCGVRFAGLEGSLHYREGVVGYTQHEMRYKAVALGLRSQITGGIDVLVTHAPPRGYADLDDFPHQGFDAFNGLLTWTRPALMLHGHVHLSYARTEREQLHKSGTRIVNCYGWQAIEL